MKKLTTTQLQWIEQALNHEIASYQQESESTDSELVRNLSAMAVESRTTLRTIISDIIHSNAKRIEVV